MARKIKVFLDTSALFAGIWSAEGGARMMLKLGEAGVIGSLVSPQVLTEIERSLREKAPDSLGKLALLLDKSGAEVLPAAAPGVLERCQAIVPHPGDAQVIASAWNSQAEYFVTLDQKHFLANEPLRDMAPFIIGTPGDFLAWLRERLST